MILRLEIILKSQFCPADWTPRVVRDPLLYAKAVKYMPAIQCDHLSLLELLQTHWTCLTHILGKMRRIELFLATNNQRLIAIIHPLQYRVYPLLQIIVICSHHLLLLSPLRPLVTHKYSYRNRDECQKSTFEVQVGQHALYLHFLRCHVVILANMFVYTVLQHVITTATFSFITAIRDILVATYLQTGELSNRCLLQLVDLIDFMSDIDTLAGCDVDEYRCECE